MLIKIISIKNLIESELENHKNYLFCIANTKQKKCFESTYKRIADCPQNNFSELIKQEGILAYFYGYSYCKCGELIEKHTARITNDQSFNDWLIRAKNLALDVKSYLKKLEIYDELIEEKCALSKRFVELEKELIKNRKTANNPIKDEINLILMKYPFMPNKQGKLFQPSFSLKKEHRLVSLEEVDQFLNRLNKLQK